MKKSPKSPKKQSAKITKLKMRVGEITSMLLQNHPKMVKMLKGGSSGYADLFMSKQLMKGGKMDVSTETKIVNFLNDNDTITAVKALKEKVIGNGETTQDIKEEFYKDLYDYKLCDKYDTIKNDDLKEDLITLDIINKFYNLVKDKDNVILAKNNTKYKIIPKQPVIDGTPAAANVEEAAANVEEAVAAAEAAAAAVAAAEAAAAAAVAAATKAEEKAVATAATAKAATESAKAATAKEATGEAAEAAIAAAEEAAAAAEEAAAEAVTARNNVAIKKAETAATKAEAKATAATATAKAAKAKATAATEAAKEATGEATGEAAEAAIAAAEAAIAAAEEAAAEAAIARNNVAIKKAEAAVAKPPVPGGKLPAKYKSLGIAVHILYKKRKYKRTIYVKDKKKTKYCKIDGEYILLSKMKVIA